MEVQTIRLVIGQESFAGFLIPTVTPTIPELTRIGAAQAPQICARDAKLVLDGFESASRAELTAEQTEIHMRLIEREPLDRCEEDRQIERGAIKRHE